MRTDLVLDALRMALGTRAPGADVALVHHSDRGSQYTSIDYTQTLDDHGMLASVGSVGDAYDNAMAESFVDSFKTELIADRVWAAAPARARPGRVRRLVQPRPPAREPRRHPAGRVRAAAVPQGSISPNGSVEEPSPRTAEALRTSPSERGGAREHSNGTESGPRADERAANGSLRSRYALAALTAGTQPTTIR